MDHKTEQDAGLLEQGASMLEEHAEESRARGNCSAAEGAACSAHAIRRLAPALLRAGRGCLAQIEEPAQPVLYVSPGQLANHSNPEGPESAKAGRYLPARKTPAGKFTQPLYAGAAPAAVAGAAWDKTRDSLATLLLGLARRPFLDFDVACIALDAATEPGMPLAYMRGATAAPALEAPAAPIPWDNFPAYLIDHCEGQTITEEGLQRALSAMLANPQYAGAAPAAPAVDALGERDAAFEAVRKRLCGLQRYSFVLDDDGVVRRAQDRTGNWIEFDDAHALFDPVAVDAARAAQAKEGGEA